ncbi:collagen, type I, alpha 1a-like [Mirounga angustirostris]|uniref:collagen, type I, alpha 1a-like n=1 Tax=Mirounga angustirostris TaxID=9716 RepID=UPI00313DCBB6
MAQPSIPGHEKQLGQPGIQQELPPLTPDQGWLGTPSHSFFRTRETEAPVTQQITESSRITGGQRSPRDGGAGLLLQARITGSSWITWGQQSPGGGGGGGAAGLLLRGRITESSRITGGQRSPRDGGAGLLLQAQITGGQGSPPPPGRGAGLLLWARITGSSRITAGQRSPGSGGKLGSSCGQAGVGGAAGVRPAGLLPAHVHPGHREGSAAARGAQGQAGQPRGRDLDGDLGRKARGRPTSGRRRAPSAVRSPPRAAPHSPAPGPTPLWPDAAPETRPDGKGTPPNNGSGVAGDRPQPKSEGAGHFSVATQQSQRDGRFPPCDSRGNPGLDTEYITRQEDRVPVVNPRPDRRSVAQSQVPCRQSLRGLQSWRELIPRSRAQLNPWPPTPQPARRPLPEESSGICWASSRRGRQQQPPGGVSQRWLGLLERTEGFLQGPHTRGQNPKCETHAG